MEAFPQEVRRELGWYVYRLIDPRNGFTFYVGKGKDDRVFHHAKGALRDVEEADGDAAATTLKLDTIRAIVREGLAVQYLIHRHGLDTAEAAYEVEAALIDAYPGLANLARGHGADRGCRSVDQIVALYGASPLEIFEPTILIYVGKSYDDRGGPYDAVRGVWRMSRQNAERHRLVLAYDGSIVIGAYRPDRWLPATRDCFPFLAADAPGRIGFEGKEAEDAARYVGKRVPARKRGDMSAFRYLDALQGGQSG